MHFFISMLIYIYQILILQNKLNGKYVAKVSSVLASPCWSINRAPCQPSLMGVILMSHVTGKCQSESTGCFVSVSLLSKENNPTTRYAYNCGIRRRSGLYIIRGRAEAALGPFRTGREREIDREEETDWLLSHNGDESVLQQFNYTNTGTRQ